MGHLVERPQSFVSKIESGERGVDFIEMQILAHVYGRPLSHFESDDLSATRDHNP